MGWLIAFCGADRIVYPCTHCGLDMDRPDRRCPSPAVPKASRSDIESMMNHRFKGASMPCSAIGHSYLRVPAERVTVRGIWRGLARSLGV